MSIKKHLRETLSELYYLLNSFIMWIPLTCIRHGWMRLNGLHLGKRAYLARNVEIRKPKNVSIGDRSVINSWTLLDGRGGKLDIGSDVDVAQESVLWTESHNPHDNSHATIGFPVTIEDYVWIGSRAMIMPNVRIGRGSVVAAGCIVTKDVEAMTIVAGIPAKTISKRNNSLEYQLNHHPVFK